jgi:hypothetical protein
VKVERPALQTQGDSEEQPAAPAKALEVERPAQGIQENSEDRPAEEALPVKIATPTLAPTEAPEHAFEQCGKACPKLAEHTSDCFNVMPCEVTAECKLTASDTLLCMSESAQCASLITVLKAGAWSSPSELACVEADIEAARVRNGVVTVSLAPINGVDTSATQLALALDRVRSDLDSTLGSIGRASTAADDATRRKFLTSAGSTLEEALAQLPAAYLGEVIASQDLARLGGVAKDLKVGILDDKGAKAVSFAATGVLRARNALPHAE